MHELAPQETQSSLLPEPGFDGYEAAPSPEESFAALEKLTIQAIASNPVFTERFEDAECRRCLYDDDGNDEKGVYFLFRAHDAATGRAVAVKATNPALSENHPHLEKCLAWEAAVLYHLKNRPRVQQICTPLKTARVTIHTDGKDFVVPVSFFSSIYLGIDVRKNFFDAANDKLKTCANRLRLFCSMISAVQSLHRAGICHRDLKPSNIMGTRRGEKCEAVLIDLGLSLATTRIETELRLFSPQVEIPQMYAAPELLSCFEDTWDIARSADIYSLGCMLFELLDRRNYYTALREANGKTFWEAANNLRIGKEECGGDHEKRLTLYHQNLDDFAPTIVIPCVSEDSILPAYARGELQAVIDSMCAFDYRKRTQEGDLDGIKQKLRRIADILNDTHLRELYKTRREIRRKKAAQEKPHD